jgi:hypothetical protein
MSEGTPNWLKPEGEATERAIERARNMRKLQMKRLAIKNVLSAFKIWCNAPANTANEDKALNTICDTICTLMEEIGVFSDVHKS